MALLMTSVLVAVADSSFWAGLQATVWAVVVTCLLSFAVYVVEAFRFYHSDGMSLLDGDYAPIDNSLHDAIGWVLVAQPLWAPFGIIGAALGAIGSNPRSAAGPPLSPVGAATSG